MWAQSPDTMPRAPRPQCRNPPPPQADEEALWEASVTAYGKVMSLCFAHSRTSGTALTSIVGSASAAFARVLSALGGTTAGEQRDAGQMRVLTWLHCALSKRDARTRSEAASRGDEVGAKEGDGGGGAFTAGLVKELLPLAVAGESWLVQRVALKCSQELLSCVDRFGLVRPSWYTSHPRPQDSETAQGVRPMPAHMPTLWACDACPHAHTPAGLRPFTFGATRESPSDFGAGPLTLRSKPVTDPS